jgi:tetratricopeptide (TPR) repeat protein
MNDSSTERRKLPASKGHQLLTLIGFSFVFFEIIFVSLYSDEFWFSLDIRLLGIPAILLVAGLSHFILLALQSDRACRIADPIWKGRPPVAYTRWVTVDGEGFSYGVRNIKWAAVDELFLTFFGNLEIRSDAFSGPVFKFPFGYPFPSEQKVFLNYARAGNPSLRVNKRLEKRIESPIVAGQNIIQLLGAAMMSLVLFDVGFSSFNYLEMLKHYHLAEKQRSASELQQADNMLLHPFPWSYVANRFLNVGSSGAGVHQARAHAELALGNLDGALIDAAKASEMTPDSFRTYLLQARILSEEGKEKEARIAIDKAIEHHKDSLLPRLYLIANAGSDSDSAKQSAYAASLQHLEESTFADEPRWPPGGNLFVHDVFYSDDVHYIFDRLLHVDSKTKKQH